VITRVRGAERQATSTGTLLRDNAVVVVENFVDGYGYADVRVGGERIRGWVILFGFVVAYINTSVRTVFANMTGKHGPRIVRETLTDNKGVLWEFLEEAFGRCALNVKVKGVRRKG